jgi:methionyl aminopeptidase
MKTLLFKRRKKCSAQFYWFFRVLIGEQMHMKPNIYNTREDIHTYGTLKVGEIYCVEPMLTNGKDNVGITRDANLWCYETGDGKDSAFFEHMVEITEQGPKILTTHIQPD